MNLIGIQNVGEFYSHHYLDTLLEKDLKGLFARWRDDEEATPDRRLNRCATDFFAAKSQALRHRQLANRYRSSHRIHVQILEALGYTYHFESRYLLDGMAVPLLGAVKRDGHEYLWLVETVFAGEDESPLEQPLLVEQYQDAAAQLSTAEEQGSGGVGEQGGKRISTAAPQHPSPPAPPDSWEELIGEIFRSAEPPRWLILLAGRFIYLIDRTKWGQGQYLLFDLDEIFGRRERETLRATAALLAREALCPEDSVPLHDTLDENSHKHAYGVSTDLKYGLRQAVELLANEYVWYMRNVRKEKLFGDDDLAGRLTDECLTYLYRLLFLFYAEARGGELDVVPMKSESYRTGYSLESLRDLEQVPLTTPQAEDGYFLHESLSRLFKLVNEGYAPVQLKLSANGDGQSRGAEEQGRWGESPTPEVYHDYGFDLRGLKSPLFDPRETPLLSSVKFRNVVLQAVLQLLSLSREGRRGKGSRGRISYAQLGINQLGAVYEGLLSYSGFFAQEELYEVKPAKAKAGDDTAQAYFIPRSDLERYEPEEFVYEAGPDGVQVRKIYPAGSFIYRLAGRDREKSASYYTPEVLTRCLVKYSLKELLPGKSADDILHLTICEPAMGSGAFINEALNQLADAYLQRKQQELGQSIPPDQYREERQKVKAYMALHNAYGVDLKALAVKLAQVSIWLNTIHRSQNAPWFSARLVVGNSLIGARRQVYSAEDVLSGAYKKKAPTAIPLGQLRPADSIYHWLLSAEGMAAFDKDKVIKSLAPDEVQAIKDWRKRFTARISQTELKNLQDLSNRADALWEQHLRERVAMLNRTREPIEVWGQGEGEPQITRITQIKDKKTKSAKSAKSAVNITPLDYNAKQRELDHLHRPTSPYRRLKLAMDYWCALWFWPIPEAGDLPERQEFLNDLNGIFAGVEGSGFEKPPEQLGLFDDAPAPKQSHFADLKPASVADLCAQNLRLKLAAETAQRLPFHHWELAFAEVFAGCGGFDLVVGNPPWVKLRWDEAAFLSDYDPLLALRKISASNVTKQRNVQLHNIYLQTSYLDEYCVINGIMSYINTLQNYSLLAGMQSNLYKCFITKGWIIGNSNSIVGLLHPEGVYDDPKGGILREHIYPRLRSHFQFQNQLMLFSEIGHRLRYSINIYSTYIRKEIGFNHISNLFHPTTVDQSYNHDDAGAVPGIKNEQENWDLRGHRNRLVWVNENLIELFCKLFDEEGTPTLQARLPLVHSEEIAHVFEKFAKPYLKLTDIPDRYFSTEIWHETNAQSDGTIKREVRHPINIDEWIVSGPHFGIATPFNKTPNQDCKSKGDYSQIDWVVIPDDYLPRTIYVPACSREEYSQRLPKWKGKVQISQYRHVNRRMLSQAGMRTLVNAIIPPQASTISTVFTISFDDYRLLVRFSGLCSSIVYDFFVKISGKGDMRHDLAALLPIPEFKQLSEIISSRTLRLNCLTTHYAALWEELYTPAFVQDNWAKQDPRLKPWANLTPHWQRHVALRTPFERRQALVEIDVLAALALDLTLDELLTIYRVQFPVLQQNERRLLFDQRGMVVPVKSVKGELVVNEADPKFEERVAPFTPVNREADYREAWGYFEERIK